MIKVGFTPNGSQYSLALHWAQYLSLYAYNHGVGPRTESKRNSVQVPFPGNKETYNAMFTSASASTLARFSIYASFRESCGGGRLFNVADRAEPCTFGDLWPALASWFGLVGTGPKEEGKTAVLKPGEYVDCYKHIFADLGLLKAAQNGVGAGKEQLDSVGWWLTFDRQLSLERLRETGFSGERDPVIGWLESFKLFRKSGLII
jgi:hypothetical protein